jgi:hypothetical protein
MLSVRGTFRDGVAQPSETVEGREGQTVLIIFVEEQAADAAALAAESEWDALFHLIEENAVETGITDLAREHNHYLYGKPKSGNE